MADGIKIEIVSPERLVLSEQAQSVSVPGAEGYFTVMGEHAPVMSILKPGFVSIVTDAGLHTVYVRGGFVEVNNSGVTVLAEDARPIAEFDRAEIGEAIATAQQTLTDASTHEDRDAAQVIIDSLKNLLDEAAHIDVPDHAN